MHDHVRVPELPVESLLVKVEPLERKVVQNGCAQSTPLASVGRHRQAVWAMVDAVQSSLRAAHGATRVNESLLPACSARRLSCPRCRAERLSGGSFPSAPARLKNLRSRPSRPRWSDYYCSAP